MSYTSEKRDNSAMLVVNPSINFARIKVKKISIAIYLVTDFISNNDPLRNRIREESIRLISELSFINSLRNNSSIRVIYNTISEIMELLDVAHSTRLVSDMNWDILKVECNDFVNFIKEKSIKSDNDNIFPKDFFKISNEELIDNSYQLQKNKYTSKNISKFISRDTGTTRNIYIKDMNKSKGQNIKYKKSKKYSVVNEKRYERRSVILNMLKKQRKITVKDISNKIQNCSGKTLQRELLSLVKEGILCREGERRWSTYSMV